MKNRIKYNIDVPEDILKINDIFRKNGHELYLVGGAVRDAISEITPKDYDLATDALPDEVEKMLGGTYKMLPIGKAFGIWQANTPSGEFEIATFREDIGSGRRPDAVSFTDIEGDVKRRDLTMNALFYDIDKKEIVDLVGGIEDLKNGIIRSVGDPAERFNEDRLRILRAIRFAGITGSELSKEMDSFLKNDSALTGISGERIKDEFDKGIIKSISTVYFLNLIDHYNLYDSIFPGLDINTNYIEDNDPTIVISTLLKNNDIHKTGKILNSLSYSNSEIENIKFLISLLSLSEENAYELKKSQKRTNLTDEQILNFSKINNINDKLINSFLKYDTTITGDDVMKTHNIKPGPEVGKYIQQLELDKFKDAYNTSESYRPKHIKSFLSFNRINEAAIAADTKFADILATNVNVKEVPRGSNRGTEIDEYFDKVGLNNRKKRKRGYPWCAAFVYAMFDDFVDKLGVANPVVKTAGVMKHWRKADPNLKIGIKDARKDPSLVKPGQVFIQSRKGGGHTGIVTSVDTKAKTFNTIEGNTNDKLSGEGHRVGRNTRKLSQSTLKGFVDYFKGNRSKDFEDTISRTIANTQTDYSPKESKTVFTETETGRGSKGIKVKQIQQKLVDLKYDLGTYGPKKDGVDGVFGKKTKAAIEKFQALNKLKVTGLADDIFFKQLMGSKSTLKDSPIDNATVTIPIDKTKEKYSDITSSDGKYSTLSLPNSTIYVPTTESGKTGGVPAFIFYPGIPVGGKIGRDYMPPLIKNAVPDWFGKYIIVIPNRHTTTWNKVKRDLDSIGKKQSNVVHPKNISVGIFSGSGNNSANISKQIANIGPVNLILMDPTPGKNLTNNISNASNVFMQYNPKNWGGAGYYVNGIDALVQAIESSGGIAELVGTRHMQIPTEILKKYRGNIEANI